MGINNDYLNSNTKRENFKEESSRPIFSKYGSNYREKIEKPQIDMNKFNCTSMERELIRKFHHEFVNIKQLGYIRIISFELFQQIMYVYFYNNIVLFLSAYKDILSDFNEEMYLDDDFVIKIKKLRKSSKKINLDFMTEKKINNYLENSYNQLFLIRDNLTRSKDTSLTFDDIYVFMKNNFHFFNCVKLFDHYNNFNCE